ncbi:MAG: ABC transporter ATP-binding protein [Lactovum sp.]
MNIIEISNLRKSFKVKKIKKEVLKGVNLTVKKGEVLCLLGSNGAGKTTMINIMSTLLKQDSGKIIINGFDLNKSAEKVRQSISLTGQFSAVDEILTGRENLELIARLTKVKSFKERSQEMLEKVDLIEVADKAVFTYSGGMKRRIDIAMSLITTPSIIFLDEPTTGLDPVARQEIYRLIKELSEIGITFFLTTQYLEEAEKLADKIAILHDGSIIAYGSFADLKKLIPAKKTIMVEQEVSLEEIYLNITMQKEKEEW